MAAGAIPVLRCRAAFTPAPKPPVANDPKPVTNLPTWAPTAFISPPKKLPLFIASLNFEKAPKPPPISSAP